MRTQWEEKQKQLAPVITDSIEVVEIAEGISEEVGSHLQRMKELAEEVASGTFDKEYCEVLQTECEQRRTLDAVHNRLVHVMDFE